MAALAAVQQCPAELTDKPTDAPPLRVAPEFLDDVRRAVARCLAAGNANLDRVAEELALSPRSLQRYLQREGTTYRILVAAARLQILGAQTRPSTHRQLARALGYCSTRSVSRRFQNLRSDGGAAK